MSFALAIFFLTFLIRRVMFLVTFPGGIVDKSTEAPFIQSDGGVFCVHSGKLETGGESSRIGVVTLLPSVLRQLQC